MTQSKTKIIDGKLMFAESAVKTFRHNNKALRYGQAFYNHMKLEKCVQDKDFCDRLYNANEATAKAMIASRLDRGN